MSALAIIVIVVLGVLLLLFVGGVIANARRARAEDPQLRATLLEADQALAQARAEDRGWDRAALCETHRAVTPGYHLNKRHWNTIVLDGSVPDTMVRDMIEDSYDLIVAALPRATRDALGWTGRA